MRTYRNSARKETKEKKCTQDIKVNCRAEVQQQAEREQMVEDWHGAEVQLTQP
jgi:hypothetical protein